MATNYPGAVDTFVNPNSAAGDTLASVPHDAQHANANDAIAAIETELGISPSGSYATVAARLADLGAKVIVLATGAPVPAGTPAGTVIVRT